MNLPDGTLTDITSDVKYVNFQKERLTLWQRLVDWYYRWKMRRLRKKVFSVTVDFVMKYDPWAEYKYQHRN